ncbi:AmmeMemoRadiSam system protein A [Acidobacteria bacterium AH-259-D05]|nr:AmmeMemoRadiSam system protein A [Acidobacteria bacterium AH-259-D05]
MDRSTEKSTAGTALELSVEDKETLLHLARQTLRDYLSEANLPQCKSYSPALRRPRSTFVTLRRYDSGELRGCRGEHSARWPLAESVAKMVIASATDDPRFSPVTIEELPDIRIEINALTPMKAIRWDEVVIGRHGLMIVKSDQSGLLLPQVPVACAWDREKFLRELCRKAGLPENAWKAQDVQLYAFESEVWGEEQ